MRWMRHRLVRLAALAVLLLAGSVVASAQEPPKPVTPKPAPVQTGCEVYATHLKGQRDTLEAQLANALAELATLRKQTVPPPVEK